MKKSNSFMYLLYCISSTIMPTSSFNTVPETFENLLSTLPQSSEAGKSIFTCGTRLVFLHREQYYITESDCNPSIHTELANLIAAKATTLPSTLRNIKLIPLNTIETIANIREDIAIKGINPVTVNIPYSEFPYTLSCLDKEVDEALKQNVIEYITNSERVPNFDPATVFLGLDPAGAPILSWHPYRGSSVPGTSSTNIETNIEQPLNGDFYNLRDN